MRFIKCNRCGKIKKAASKGWIEGSTFGDSVEAHIRFDLCPSCSPKLIEFLKRYLKPVKLKIA